MDTVACGLLGSNPNDQTPPAIVPQGPVQLPDAMTEARCSVNAYFYLPGYTDRLQATGRGATPQEAARNLRATMEATRQELAPPPLPSREARLAQLLTKGLACAVQRGDTGLVERLAKACHLVLAKSIEPTECAGSWAVRSQHDPDTWYTVEGTACSCPDWHKHREETPRYLCKHVLSCLLTHKLNAQEQEGL